MISVNEAHDIVKEYNFPFSQKITSIESLSNGTLAQDICADRDYPPFNRVMMDGIAVNFDIFKHNKAHSFPIADIAPAGEIQKILSNKFECIEVMTGAPLPIGCDLVIPYEQVEIVDNIANVIGDNYSLFDNVHHMGSDAKTGEVIVSKGQRLNGPIWGILASFGITEVLTSKSPNINIISTGDELVDCSERPEDHQIRRSNSIALSASLKKFGYTDLVQSHLNDNPDEINSHFKQSCVDYDILIYSGGVSKGKFDYLPETWANNGVKKLFHGVSQRPGKPLYFGIHEKTGTLILGLPGNPISSLVCLHRYLLVRKPIYVELQSDVVFMKNLTCFKPVKLHFNDKGVVEASPIDFKNSGDFSILSKSDGFIELPVDKELFKKGEVYPYYPWSPIWQS